MKNNVIIYLYIIVFAKLLISTLSNIYIKQNYKASFHIISGNASPIHWLFYNISITESSSASGAAIPSTPDVVVNAAPSIAGVQIALFRPSLLKAFLRKGCPGK